MCVLFNTATKGRLIDALVFQYAIAFTSYTAALYNTLCTQKANEKEKYQKAHAKESSFILGF